MKLFGMSFKNPVFIASGVFGFGLKYRTVSGATGAFFTKGITLAPRAGNPPPRIYETPSGVINWVGLENPGVRVFTKTILPKMKRLKTRIFVNVAGFTPEEFGIIVGEIGERVDGFELNVSCPNVKDGGSAFGQSPRIVAQLTAIVRKKTKRPIIVKLTPNFCDPLTVAQAAVDGGADGISLINTLYGMKFDIVTGKPLITGGLSGPAVRPFALYCVHRVSRLRVPVIGIGGIMTGRDAYEYLLAGAAAAAVGSAVLRDPYAPLAIIRELKMLVKKSKTLTGADVNQGGV